MSDLPRTGPSASNLPQFDRVAKLYRWAEYAALGPLLQRVRVRWLLEVGAARRALVLGDGDGRFLAALLQVAPALRATAVDSSDAMLHLLRRRCRFAAHRLTTFHGSASVLVAGVPVEATDLVVTHFFLDCLSQSELEALIQHLAGRLPADAVWLHSDFGIPRRQPWRALGQLYVHLLYQAFGILTGLRVRSLPAIQPHFERAGLTRIHHAEWLKGLLYSQVWQRSADPQAASGATRPTAGPSTQE